MGHLRIAVVERDDLIAQLILRWLADAGYSAVASDDAAISAGGFDLIIADAPSALDAALRVDQFRRLSRAPILLMSARFPPEAAGSADVAARVGAAAVLPKPFTQDALVAAVLQALTS